MADPRHVAIAMDGNGRWATARGLHRTAAHGAPRVADRLRAQVRAAEELTAGDPNITMVFAFNYGSRAEIAAAARRLAAEAAAGGIDPGTIDVAGPFAHLE